MNSNVILLLLSISIAAVFAAPLLDDIMQEQKSNQLSRVVRQIGYGGASAGLGSQLSGISSGYGYGYNNAVGLSGAGQQAGTNYGVFPGVVGMMG